MSSLPLAAAAALAFLGAAPAGPEPAGRPGAAPVEAVGVEFFARCADDSALRVRVLDERLELTTRHGVLRIAVADIGRIDFATRIPPDVAQKAAAAALRLGHPDFDARDRASAELKAYGARALPALTEAAKGTDAEVVRRAEELLKLLRRGVPAADLAHREWDEVHTEDSKITGRLSAPTLRVRTMAFGEQPLRLTDLRSLGPKEAAKPAGAALPAPQSLMAYAGQIGADLTFTVTGNVGGGAVWGSDAYTLDSSLAAAAVHAGKVQVGQTETVRVRIVASPPAFGGGVRNGVAAAPYGPFPAGAFEFVDR